MSRSRVPLPVAASWFHLEDIDERLTLITEPHVDGLLAANTWWIHGGDRDAVIDTGLGVASLRSGVPRLFGHRPLAIITHAHLDHLGGAHEFDEIAAHEAELALIAQPYPGSLSGPALFADLGLAADDATPDLLIDALPAAGYDPDAYRVQPADVTTVLREGDVIDLGGIALSVMHLPGHTAGSIALLEERSGTLFTGDVIYDEELLDEIVGADIAAYIETMHRLRTLDVAVVRPGHGPSFDGARLIALADQYLAARNA